MENPVRLFISFAKEDEAFRLKLERHLQGLMHQSLITFWDQSQIRAGENWVEQIRKQLSKAEIVLMLVSSNFLSSSYIYDKEVSYFLRKERKDEAIVIPIILKPCLWEKSPIGKLSVLPRNGKPISTWKNEDEAFLIISKGILNAVGIIRERRNLKKVIRPTISTNDQKINIGNIFKTAGVPTFNYIPPMEYNRLIDELETLGKGLAIEGPSGIGKTTLVKKAFEALNKNQTDHKWIKGTAKTEIKELENILTSNNVKDYPKYLFIDDFHHLEFKIKKKVAIRIKEFADSNAPLKIVVIGINKVGYSLMSDFPELSGRVGILPIEKQSDEIISQVISAGEFAANLKFSKKREIIEAANGSYFTTQMLCLHIAYHANVTKSQKRTKIIKYSPNDVMSKVLRELEFKYREALNDFVTIDYSHKSKGACFTLIWLLKEQKQGYVRIDESILQYPNLKDTFDWLEKDGLSKGFKESKRLNKVFYYDPKVKMIAIEDPQLEFFLENISWSEFANRTGHKISFSEDGQLKVHCLNKPEKVKPKDTTNPHIQWWKTASLIGLIAGILLTIVLFIPSDWFIIKIAIIFSIGVAIFIGLRNPKTRFIRAFWSVFGLFSFAHVLPAFGIEATGSDIWVKIVTEGPGAIFNIVIGCILITLLILDKMEQSPKTLK